jgi:hypothetical protein
MGRRIGDQPQLREVTSPHALKLKPDYRNEDLAKDSGDWLSLAGSFLLYSLGKNRTDDGGVAQWEDGDGDDFVIRVPVDK